MNPKTVSKILARKHADFMKHIDDPEVVEIFNKHSIITAGSIVSLLLNEKVNDYDYYLTDKTSCHKVAQYFVDKYNKSHPEGAGKKPGVGAVIKPTAIEEDGRIRIVIKSVGIASDQETKSAYEYFESRPLDEGEEYVDNVTMGRTVNEKIPEADDLPAGALEQIDDGKDPYRVIFMTSNAITLANSVQVVIRFYGPAEEIHKNYDFVHCTNYWIPDGKKLYLNQPALESILSRTLYYTGSLYPLCSVIRTRKFIKKGWHINAGQYLKMCFQISELNLKDINVLDDQLIGVDCAYFFQVIDYLKDKQNKDPEFKIELPYLVSIIDKIF